MKHLAISLGALLVLSLGAVAEVRTWTNAEGKTIEAEYVSADGEKLTLQLRNSKRVTIELKTLSEADQKWVTDKVAAAEAEAAAAEAAKAAVPQEIADHLVKLEDGKLVDYKWETTPQYYLIYVAASW